MTTPPVPDTPFGRDTLFGVIPRSALQIAFGACFSFLEQFLGAEFVPDRLFGILAPNVLLALSGFGENFLQTLQGGFSSLSVDDSEDVIEIPFDSYDVLQSFNEDEVEEGDLPSEPSSEPHVTELHVAEPPEPDVVVSIPDAVHTMPPTASISEVRTLSTTTQLNVVEPLLVFVSAVVIGFVCVALIMRSSVEESERPNVPTTDSPPVVDEVSQPQCAEKDGNTSNSEPLYLESGSDVSDNAPLPSNNPGWYRPVRILLPVVVLRTLVSRLLRRGTVNASSSTSPEDEAESPIPPLSDQLIGVGKEWDTLSGSCQIDPECGSKPTSSEIIVAGLNAFKNGFRALRSTVSATSPLKAVEVFLDVWAHFVGTRHYIPVLLTVFPLGIYFEEKERLHARTVATGIEREKESESRQFPPQLVRGHDGKIFLALSGEEQAGLPPDVLFEKEDDRPCAFGHTPVVDYVGRLFNAPDVISTTSSELKFTKAPESDQQVETLTAGEFQPIDPAQIPLPKPPVPSKIPRPTHRRTMATASSDESLIVRQEDLADPFEDPFVLAPTTAESDGLTQAASAQAMDQAGESSNVADDDDDDDDEDDALVTNLIRSAAQSTENIVFLANSIGSYDGLAMSGSEVLKFAMDHPVNLSSATDPPLLGLTADDELEHSAYAEDNMSICSDAGSYVTAGDSDEEMRNVLTLVGDDEDLESYHSPVENNENNKNANSDELRDLQALKTPAQSTEDAVVGVQEESPLAGHGPRVETHDGEVATPTKVRNPIEDQSDQESDGSLYEACPQSPGVRYIDDSDVDFDEPEPANLPPPPAPRSQIPRFNIGNNLFSSRSLYRFEMLNLLTPIRRTVGRSVSLAALGSRVDMEDSDPSAAPKGRIMKLKDKQMKERLKDMTQVKERENANDKRQTPVEKARPRFSI